MRHSTNSEDFFVEAANNNRPDLGYGIEIMMDDFGDHNGYPREQRLADAHLIAAAPDLLEACERALSIFKQLAEVGKYPEMLLQENGGEGLMFLETAISNAKGEQK